MSNKEKHWAKTRGHMFLTLALWAFFSMVVFLFGHEINHIKIMFGYPLAYYMTAQGSLLAFVLIIFWFANRQEKIDEEFGFGEKED